MLCLVTSHTMKIHYEHMPAMQVCREGGRLAVRCILFMRRLEMGNEGSPFCFGGARNYVLTP